ncbi:MAG: hypothetical protein JRJ12_12560 [Deltaproteobacteria bacterium]|nr:hypothetical protein [Deltaproteobacteria bacterium]MBW2071798.1 hypothetical protein [Deltaproteobacteria bacterium]
MSRSDSTAAAIRAAHSALSRGEKVYRWQGPSNSVAAAGDLVFGSLLQAESLTETEPVVISASDRHHLVELKRTPAALLMEKSFLWGYIAVSVLKDLGFFFELLSASQVRKHTLSHYSLLIVPGGWAHLKSKALGHDGREEVRRFVQKGGGYLGICGGAGLALQVDEGLGLVPVARKAMWDRLPNFSGSIQVRQSSNHPLWWGLGEAVPLQVWWPSQFDILDQENLTVLGRYGHPEKDFCVSDLNVHQAEAAGLDWSSLEREYEINLNPEMLLDEPAIIEGQYGEGRVVLSYPHLETPGDEAGNLALFNLWHDLLATSACQAESKRRTETPTLLVDEESLDTLKQVAQQADELVSFGARCGIWSWRNPWLLQWKRGIRGAEFGTVCVLLRGLLRELEGCQTSTDPGGKAVTRELCQQLRILGDLWQQFYPKGRALLQGELQCLQGDAMGRSASIVRADTNKVKKEIFNCIHCYGSKSYGGLYRRLLDQIDKLLSMVLCQ